MIQKFKKLLIPLGLLMLLWVSLSPALAQEPRPTPTVASAQETPRPTETPIPATVTPVPPTATPPSQQTVSNAEPRGSIQGVVYEDIDGDGTCVGTGVSGEDPIADVTVQFVSSDEKTVINLTSGPDGGFGLFAAGLSYWAVTAVPGSDWVVTSVETQYAPVYEDSLNVTDVNFCVQKASAARVLLPASGGNGSSLALTALWILGVVLVVLGIVFEIRPKVD